MKDYEDEAFDELEKAQQRKVATGVTDGSKTEANSTLSALKLALEALKEVKSWKSSTAWSGCFDKEIEELEKAIAKEPAPVQKRRQQSIS
jgi:hypothetical protein